MSKFKVGDWVVTVHGLSQVEEVVTDRVDGIVMYNTTNGCYQEDFKLWSPTEGEWCWFYGAIDMNYNVPAWFFGRYNYDNFFIMDGIDEQIEFTDCEPFVGNLPNFIKREIG